MSHRRHYPEKLALATTVAACVFFATPLSLLLSSLIAIVVFLIACALMFRATPLASEQQRLDASADMAMNERRFALEEKPHAEAEAGGIVDGGSGGGSD